MNMSKGLTRAASNARKDRQSHFRYLGKDYTFKECHGEAHKNPHIDHCGICAPFWGVIVVPYDLRSDAATFVQWLSETLIPDCRESGSDGHAESYAHAARLIRSLLERAK